MNKSFFKLNIGEGPLIICAIHNGNYIREELHPYLALNEKERLYEEDPFTAFFTDISDTSLIANHSRFEIDLNREKSGAIYLKPEQAWGLNVWKKPLPSEIIKKLHELYDNFYSQAEAIINNKIIKYGFALIYDIHSYNYKRNGKEAPAIENPDINVGTNGLNRKFWDPVIQHFIKKVKEYDYFGKHLDVRENIKFRGGHFSTWINNNFENKACALAIEVKKIFMDEHTNEINEKALSEIKKAIEKTIPGAVEKAASLFGTKVIHDYR